MPTSLEYKYLFFFSAELDPDMRKKIQILIPGFLITAWLLPDYGFSTAHTTADYCLNDY